MQGSHQNLPMALQDSSNTYVYGHGLISQTTTGGDRSYVHSDGLGSTRALSDPSGSVSTSYSYDAFGALRSGSASGTEMRFTGQIHDAALGMDYMRARYYDPAVGRFISKDPIGFAGGDANLYGYVGNDPVNWIDPQGLNAVSDILTLPGDTWSLFAGSDAWEDNGAINWSGWDETANFAAGWGDAGSFGLTYWLRDINGLNEYIDVCSRQYGSGSVIGAANNAAVFGGWGGVRSTGLARAWNTRYSSGMPFREEGALCGTRRTTSVGPAIAGVGISSSSGSPAKSGDFLNEVSVSGSPPSLDCR